ncbi:hypothetical protein GGI15_003142 [Coemansia interrupta]|uniref:Uncharacterized protein n=1 Tax=Coemansia interrupta TaxID=1126814 RepID=A0A9W8LJN1_9FUNG|nr:hypothetical protein GGI15_003142 [Coemansia interrupta]
MATNHSRPISEIVVFGMAGKETDDTKRAKLCGGNLWIDHLAEALNADLVSYAHGYSIRNKTIVDRRILTSRRSERVKSPLGNGQTVPVYQQVRDILANPEKDTASSLATLFILVVDPPSVRNESGEGEVTAKALVQAANDLILNPRINARRLLVIDTPMSASRPQKSLPFDSLDLSSRLVTDPSVEISTYDSHGFLRRMQSEYYKYGLKHPDSPCIYNQARRCNRPDRFFWCDREHVGSKAHFFMADDIIRKHFLTSIPG